MARSHRGELVTTLRYPARVEVRRPKFERSTSLAHLDVAKLSRTARAEFEVGHFNADGCRQPVLAVIRKGMVTDLRVEGCTQRKPIRLTAEFQRMLNNAQRRIGRHREKPFRPVPVAEFLGKARVAAAIIEEGCHEFCIITILGYEICVFCCKVVGGPWYCGPIVHTVLE